MKRIINNRPLCFFAAMLSLGIALALCAANNNIAKIAIIVAFAICVVSLCFIKKARKFVYLPLAILIGAASFFISQNLYLSKTLNESDTVFTAKIASEIIVENEKTSFEVNNIILNDKKIGGNASVYIPMNVEPNFNAGDIVEIQGSLKSDDFLPADSYFASSYSKRNTKFCFATSVTKIAEQKPNFILSIEMKIKQMFFENTKEDTASICIALIYGDKTGINSTLYNDIKTSGLAHILAVSGLHVTILAGAFAFLLKKLKCNKKISAFIIIFFLFIYAMFCGFSSSITRAFIVCSVFLLSDAFGKKRDSLSNLALAGILILIVNPIVLFEVGFLLSFCSVLGILLFYRTFNYAFRKTGKVVSPMLSTSLSANIMTYPIIAKYFGVFPVFFLISNIIILPFVSVVYILILFFTLLVLIFPISSILFVFDYVLFPFKAVVFTLGSFAVAKINVSSLGLLALAYYFDAIILSRFVFLKKRTKIILLSIVSSISIILAIFL